jgi:hypothetical protein
MYQFYVGSKLVKGWEQFLLVNQGTFPGAYVEIEYWMYGYGTCPSGWTQYNPTDCTTFSLATWVGYENPAYLIKYSLSGSVTSSTDTATFCDQNKHPVCYASSSGDIVKLASGYWFQTEFNILGYANGSTAIFNSGLSLSLYVTVGTSSTACGSPGFSGEKNNLNLVPPCTPGAYSISFTEH